MKAKVDHLNLVFVILNLVLVAGKLYVECEQVCVCVCVCMSMLAQCLLIASAFTVTSRSWKHVGFFVVSDVGIWEKPALRGSTALWTELRLEVAEASGDGWPPTPPGET